MTGGEAWSLLQGLCHTICKYRYLCTDGKRVSPPTQAPCLEKSCHHSIHVPFVVSSFGDSRQQAFYFLGRTLELATAQGRVLRFFEED